MEPGVVLGEVVVDELPLVDSNHPSAHAGAEEVDCVCAEPAPQNPVKGRRHSSPYNVAEDRGAGLESGMGLNLAGKLTYVGYVLAERNDRGALPGLIARSIEASTSSMENSCSGTMTASQPQAIEA